MDRRVSLSRACEEGTEIVLDEKSPIEELFEPVTKAMSLYFFNIDRGPKHSKLNRLAEVIQIVTIVSSFYYLSYSIYTVCMIPMNELTTLLFFFLICVLIVTTTGLIIMFNWQRKGSIRRFFRLLHSANEGRGVKRDKEKIMKLNRRMRWFRNFMLGYSLFFVVYMASGIKPYGIEFERFSKILYFERLLFIYNLTSSYLLIGWTIQLHTYCYCIQVALSEINYFIQEAVEFECSSEAEAISLFTDSIRRNARLSLSVRHLDEILKRFAFFQIGMVIPSTLFVTFATIMRIHAPLLEFIPSLILVILSLALFHILTIHPARLHNQVKKTRALFCSNIRQWIPYGQSVHTAALVLSSHLEQNDVGVTIWGFALLSKPLILTSLSAMTTALAIFLQFSDCKKQIMSSIGFQNTTKFDLMPEEIEL